MVLAEAVVPDGVAPDGVAPVGSRFLRTGSTSASRGFSRGSTPAIDHVAEQRVLDFLDEQPLAADLGERPLLQPIPVGLDHDDRAGRTAGGGDARGHRAGLPQRELAAARAETKRLFGVHAKRAGGGYRRPPVGRSRAFRLE